MITATSELRDVAGAVARALRQIGRDPVVVGGSAATIYAPAAYRSDDIDLVIVGGIDDTKAVVKAMASIRFTLRNAMFVHSVSPFTVEIVPSPVAIGKRSYPNLCRDRNSRRALKSPADR
jgi:hypothetical protein